jgi:Gluconate 2-dehydrogenase subunit 3
LPAFCGGKDVSESEKDSGGWIIDAKTGRPRPPVKQPGYYPGFSTLSQKNFWDAATRRLVEDRVQNVPSIRFFIPDELPIMTAVCNRIVTEDDRLPEFRIPVVNYIDERLFENKIDGYRYEDMPSDQDAHRLGLKAIDLTSQALHTFHFIDPLKQDLILKSIHEGNKSAAHEIWDRMSVQRYWQLLVGDCVAAYYAHPWAWDEIGFGGPAYPRAYIRLEGGEPEPWEVDEQPYEWLAPRNSASDIYEPGSEFAQTHPGQGGTH